jgi:hypothetical protein
MKRDRNKLPKSLEKKWAPDAVVLMYAVFGDMVANQAHFRHPKASEVPAEQWETTAWNAAWIAAYLLTKFQGGHPGVCGRHPRYLGQRAPRADCNCCRAIWAARGGAKKR